jgi:hypothetical protein
MPDALAIPRRERSSRTRVPARHTEPHLDSGSPWCGVWNDFVESTMPSVDDPPKQARIRANAGRVLTWWFGAMSAFGLAFGSMSEQRPFGSDVPAQPLVIFFAVVAAALLVLRFALRGPVSALISDRMLLVGCGIGILAFLIGNWFGAHLSGLR